ncbi:MAG: P-II family nitrogen regulator [Clostridiales bacterium]|nr:P-II family nitrogen regulator [Clostridiales bacterium]
MTHELIVCIVNTGFTDVVMDAAKEVGARGGTVIHGRGTANKEAEEFFHISIQPDKEMVMILVPAEIKDAVLHAVYGAAGLKTAGQGIAFSLPVTNVVGISSAPTQQTAAAEEEKPETTDKENK